MPDITYALAKSIEYMSIHVGTGPFEIPSPEILCSTCRTHDGDGGGDICDDCKESYVHEVSQMEYSDAFEREVNMTVGVAGLVMGGAAAVGNRCLGGLWEEGVLVSMILNTIMNTLPPTLFDLDPGLRTLSNYLLVLLTFSSLLVIAVSTLVACFVMAMNPGSERHWRHMTWGVYLVVALQTACYSAALWMGVGPVEVLLVVIPVVMGAGALGCLICMKGEGEGRIRLEEEEEEEGRGDLEKGVLGFRRGERVVVGVGEQKEGVVVVNEIFDEKVDLMVVEVVESEEGV